jgi:hypothetical protein
LSDSSAFEFDIVTTVGVKWEDDFLGWDAPTFLRACFLHHQGRRSEFFDPESGVAGSTISWYASNPTAGYHIPQDQNLIISAFSNTQGSLYRNYVRNIKCSLNLSNVWKCILNILKTHEDLSKCEVEHFWLCDRWRALVNSVLNLRVPWNALNYRVA